MSITINKQLNAIHHVFNFCVHSSWFLGHWLRSSVWPVCRLGPTYHIVWRVKCPWREINLKLLNQYWSAAMTVTDRWHPFRKLLDRESIRQERKFSKWNFFSLGEGSDSDHAHGRGMGGSRVGEERRKGGGVGRGTEEWRRGRKEKVSCTIQMWISGKPTDAHKTIEVTRETNLHCLWTASLSPNQHFWNLSLSLSSSWPSVRQDKRCPSVQVSKCLRQHATLFKAEKRVTCHFN